MVEGAANVAVQRLPGRPGVAGLKSIDDACVVRDSDLALGTLWADTRIVMGNSPYSKPKALDAPEQRGHGGVRW